MNFRAPYSPPLPARKPRKHSRPHISAHDDTHPQISWNHRSSRAGGRVVIDGNDAGADALARRIRAVASDLLCGGRHRLGATGDADHQLDGAAESLELASQRRSPASTRRPTTSPAARAANVAAHPK